VAAHGNRRTEIRGIDFGTGRVAGEEVVDRVKDAQPSETHQL
jgi:hypothetical protein